MQKRRTVVPAPHVVLPGPYRLDRRVGGFGDVDRLDDEVGGGIGPAAETPAEESGMDFDLGRPEPGDAGRELLIERLELGAGPDLALAPPDAHRAIERLHRSVGEVGDRVFRFDGAGGTGDRCGWVTAGGRRRPPRPRQLAELGPEPVAVQA